MFYSHIHDSFSLFDIDFVIGMQYNHYTVNEKSGSITICVVVMDTTPAVQRIVNFTISTSGTADGELLLEIINYLVLIYLL